MVETWPILPPFLQRELPKHRSPQRKKVCQITIHSLVVYCSTATHAWIEKAAFFFGIGTKGIRWIEQQDNGKIRLELLEQAIIQDLKNGYSPMMVIGNAGDVSTGAIDDLKAIGAICKKYNLWFHIDGAYGAPAAVIPTSKILSMEWQMQIQLRSILISGYTVHWKPDVHW